MSWKLQRHKVGNGQQELNVSILVREMQETWGKNSEDWISQFHSRLKDIKRTNSFSAEYGFKATPKNHTSLEVWKMKANGDFNYKMFTLTYDSNT